MKYLALITFLVAAVTDLFDGWDARKRNEVTDLGKLLDPIADKLLVISALLVFVQMEIISAWMAIVIIGREFLITGLRFVGLSKGIMIPAGRWGKHKTAWQMVAIIAILVILCIRDENSPGWMEILPHYLMLIAVVASVISAGIYLWENRYLLK